MTNEQIKQIINDAPEHATHFDGKTYFRFEMYEHGQAYLIFKNAIWDRGLPAYPVYGCHSLADLREISALREENEELTQWITAISNGHQQVPDWIKQSAKSLLVNQATKGGEE